jgi:hypothetical protein
MEKNILMLCASPFPQLFLAPSDEIYYLSSYTSHYNCAVATRPRKVCCKLGSKFGPMQRAPAMLPEINSEGGGTEMRLLKDYSLAKMINL